MSCLYCVYYVALKTECLKGRFVENLSESFDCPHYTYNKEVKVNE